MGNVPYLLMLSIYGIVLYWYVRNEYRGEDALFGIFALRKDELYDPVFDEDLIEVPLSPRDKIRKIVADSDDRYRPL